MFTRRLAVAIGLLFALVGAQGPEFSQQYRQRLGGALDELTRIVATFDADAAHQSITRGEAIARLEGNPDPLAQGRGAAIEGDIARQERLQRTYDEMKTAGAMKRIADMTLDFDPAIGAQTLANFEPAVPITSETLVFGGMALVFGWGATHLFAWPIRRRWRERAAARQATRAA
jgi:Protein of unknown function (DUF2937)